MKIKGITQNTKQNGEVVYRVDTSINGKKYKGQWSRNMTQVMTELQTIRGSRIDRVAKNQRTKNNGDCRLATLVEKFNEHLKQETTITDFKTKRGFSYLINNDEMKDLEVSKITNEQLIELCKETAIDREWTGETLKRFAHYLETMEEFAKSENIPFSFSQLKLKSFARSLPKKVGRVDFMTAREVAIMYKYIEEQIVLGRQGWDQFHGMVTLALYNGMRLGEVLALQYRDINLDPNKKTIFIRRTITGHAEQGYVKESTKNGSSRKIVMADHSYDILKSIVDENKGVNETDFIFQNKNTMDAYCAKFVTSRLKEMRACGVYPKTYCFHTLRHSFASLYFKAKGTNHGALRQLRDLLGHGSVVMTEKYVHVYESQDPTLLEGLSFSEANAFETAKKAHDKKEKDLILNGQSLSLSNLSPELLVKISELIQQEQEQEVA